MEMNEYQKMAARTINPELSHEEAVMHAVLGLNSEAGEIAGIFQKKFQGHEVDKDHLTKEMGDVLWFLAELCTEMDISLTRVGMENIVKLKKRFPNGFESIKSLNRAEGDI